jgi:hypothetical protein
MLKKKSFATIIVVILAILINSFTVSANQINFDSEDIALAEYEMDSFFLENGIEQSVIDDLTFAEKELLRSAAAPLEVDEYTLDVFLSEIGFPDDVLSEMDITQKYTIFSSLESVADVYDVSYAGYQDKLVSFPTSTTTSSFEASGGMSTQGAISSTYLLLSATAVYVGNNLNRYYIYPSFEWRNGGGTQIYYDAFSYAVHDDYWNALSTGDLDIYVGSTLIDTLTTPTSVGFSARSYSMSGYGIPDVTLPYKGTACLIARPLSTTVDDRIIINYAQDLGLSIGVSLGSFSISVTGSVLMNSAGRELHFL